MNSAILLSCLVIISGCLLRPGNAEDYEDYENHEDYKDYDQMISDVSHEVSSHEKTSDSIEMQRLMTQPKGQPFPFLGW